MKTIYSLVSAILFTVFFTSTSTAQAGSKIGIIFPAAFDDAKNGIVKYYKGLTALENEFKPLSKELETMQAKLQVLSREIQDLQNVTARQAKITESEKLQNDIKRKQEDANIRYEKRRKDVLGPLLQDIGKAMTEFSKANNYQVIFDGEKMESSGMILAIGESADVTAAFIKYYNARPGQ